MGKILIKNKKGTHSKPAQNKKPAAAATDQTAATAATDQTAAASTQDSNTPSQDEANPAPSTQENPDENDKSQGKFSYIPKLDV